MAAFNWRMRSEVVQPFWAALQAGEFITGAAEQVGSYREMGGRWIAAECGIRPSCVLRNDMSNARLRN